MPTSEVVVLLRFPLEPLLSLCEPDRKEAASRLDRRLPHRLVLAGSSDEPGLELDVIPSLPWPPDLRAWRLQLLSEDLPSGLQLAPLREEALTTQAGWPVTVVLAAVCQDPSRVDSYRQERIGYFFTMLDTVAAVRLWINDRAAYGRIVPSLKQALQAAEADWEPGPPATLSQLWATPTPPGKSG